MFKLLIALGLASIVIGTPTPRSPPPSLPSPSGHYNVGLKKFKIPYHNTNDPFWPNGVSKSFIATIFYPTLSKPNTNSKKPQPYLDPITAQLYEANYQFKNQTLSSLTASFLIKNAAPLKKASLPTILFGPGGGGPPVEVYTSLLSDLASHGNIVIGLDHPYEQPFVRYPNGTGILGLAITYPWTVDLAIAGIDARIKETAALLDYLPTLSKKFGAHIDNTHVGAFGHSLGGVAAIGSQLRDSRIVSAINMDGKFFGDLASDSSAVDVKRNVLLFGQEQHLGEDEATDSSWGVFRRQQTGWWRQILVKGALHLDFSDATVWKGFPPWVSTSFGTIEGERSVEIERAVVRAFFDFTLRGKGEVIFDRLGEKFPELNYYAGGNWTA